MIQSLIRSVERILPDRLSTPKSYIAAMLLVGLGAILRWRLPYVLGSTPFLAFYPVVVFSAALGGFGPGIFSVALSWIFVAYFFDITPGILGLAHIEEVERLIVFFLGGLGVSIVSEAQLRGKERQANLAKELGKLTQLTDLGTFFARDESYRIMHWSDGCARLYGYSAEEAIGKISHELLKTEFPAPMEEIHAILRREGRWEGELKHICKSGTSLAISSQWVMQAKSSNIVLEVNTDITRLKETEKSLLQTTQELKRSNEELEHFAYITSHDLQEPLRSVTGFLSLLKERYGEKLDSKADQYIAFAVDGATRMSQLINDLLLYSRVGRKEKPPKETNTEESLNAALGNLRAAISDADADITHEGLPIIMGDSGHLTQLFQNLIGNALKFRKPERKCSIHIAARKKSGCWEFSVKDNGIGISPEYHAQIFEIFRRLHNRQSYSGTGIGLAICKKIVERRGGTIWVESHSDAGATFFFTIPA